MHAADQDVSAERNKGTRRRGGEKTIKRETKASVSWHGGTVKRSKIARRKKRQLTMREES